jgi:2-C-methyl-D-erythritol 4-phosphate cytidylyltransferase
MHKYAVIVAAGSGTRFGGEVPKQFQEIRGKSLLWHSVNAFQKTFNDIRLIIVLPSGLTHYGDDLLADFPDSKMTITTGGDTRFQSVKNGLEFVTEDSIVSVHDAVRCLVSPALIQRVYETAEEKGNAIPAISSNDTVRFETGSEFKLVDRKKVKMIQTPQAFRSEILKKAFLQEFDEAFTDEATVVENAGFQIFLTEGEETNIKVTHPADLKFAELFFKQS